uniref:Maturase K n=1 Tax=Panagrolaimus superbus TaxID=310955 RepID=A0A914YQ36_9BILA
MVTSNLFHMINLLITKSNSNSTLFLTCEIFLALIGLSLETEDIISGKELLQITTIFVLALKSRDSSDDSFQLLSRTFLHFVGLLFSKFYQIMIQRNSAPLSQLEQKGMIILPSLCCIESYWDSFDDKLSPSDSYLSKSNLLDFSIVRKNIKLLGHLLYFYVGTLNISVKRANNETASENIYVLPEIILCCMGSRFPVKTAPLQLNTTQKYSETFKTFLIRVLLVQDLLARMVKKEYFGINSFYEYCPGLYGNEISRHIYTLFESNDQQHKRYPMRAQQNIPKVTPVYPVGVIPPHYISPRNGVWIKDGFE